jgi:cytochrome c-type protein NapC
MSEKNNEGKECSVAPKQGFFSRLLNPPKCSMLQMIVIGVFGGIIIWGGLNMGMEYTNHSEFCTSCHEMTIPFEELKKTVHFKNRSGATAQCADCHVASSKTPTDYLFKSFQKIMAARDVIGHIKGTVDTPEKFEAYRLTMAQRVWDRMIERDSKECRNCHQFESMDTEKQKDRSVVKHEGAIEDGKTCIECHKGIAHKPVHNQAGGESGAPKSEG